MDDPRDRPGLNEEEPLSNLLTEVQRMDSAEGTAFVFSLLDEETKSPCFRLAFESAEDARQGREMMAEIIEHCMWFEVPDPPSS
jgi:hypothetical protein